MVTFESSQNQFCAAAHEHHELLIYPAAAVFSSRKKSIVLINSKSWMLSKSVGSSLLFHTKVNQQTKQAVYCPHPPGRHTNWCCQVTVLHFCFEIMLSEFFMWGICWDGSLNTKSQLSMNAIFWIATGWSLRAIWFGLAGRLLISPLCLHLLLINPLTLKYCIFSMQEFRA